jgi:hypothetical protein
LGAPPRPGALLALFWDMSGATIACLCIRQELSELLNSELARDGITLVSWGCPGVPRGLSSLAARVASERPAGILAALLYPFSEHLAQLKALVRRGPDRPIPLILLTSLAGVASATAGEVSCVLKPPYEIPALCAALRAAARGGFTGSGG